MYEDEYDWEYHDEEEIEYIPTDEDKMFEVGMSRRDFF